MEPIKTNNKSQKVQSPKYSKKIFYPFIINCKDIIKNRFNIITALVFIITLLSFHINSIVNIDDYVSDARKLTNYYGIETIILSLIFIFQFGFLSIQIFIISPKKGDIKLEQRYGYSMRNIYFSRLIALWLYICLILSIQTIISCLFYIGVSSSDKLFGYKIFIENISWMAIVAFETSFLGIVIGLFAGVKVSSIISTILVITLFLFSLYYSLASPITIVESTNNNYEVYSTQDYSAINFYNQNLEQQHESILQSKAKYNNDETRWKNELIAETEAINNKYWTNISDYNANDIDYVDYAVLLSTGLLKSDDPFINYVGQNAKNAQFYHMSKIQIDGFLIDLSNIFNIQTSQTLAPDKYFEKVLQNCVSIDNNNPDNFLVYSWEQPMKSKITKNLILNPFVQITNMFNGINYYNVDDGDLLNCVLPLVPSVISWDTDDGVLHNIYPTELLYASYILISNVLTGLAYFKFKKNNFK